MHWCTGEHGEGELWGGGSGMTQGVLEGWRGGGESGQRRLGERPGRRRCLRDRGWGFLLFWGGRGGGWSMVALGVCSREAEISFCWGWEIMVYLQGRRAP